MKKPRSITFAAIYCFVRGGLLIIISIAERNHASDPSLRNLLIQDIPLDPDRFDVLLTSSVMMAAALFFCVLGIGLLSLWTWARWVTLLSAGAGALRVAATLVIALPFSSGDISQILSPATATVALIQGVICFSLMQDDVKRAFLEPGVY